MLVGYARVSTLDQNHKIFATAPNIQIEKESNLSHYNLFIYIFFKKLTGFFKQIYFFF